MKQYRIQVDFGTHEYNEKGNIFAAIYWFIKEIDKGAFIKITEWKD